MRSITSPPRHSQQGVALIIALLLLLVLSIAAFFAMRLVANQNDIARNVWAEHMSVSSAQGSLAIAQNLVLTGKAVSGNGVYVFDADAKPKWSQTAFTWSSGDVLALANFSNTQYPGSKGRAIKERLPVVMPPGYGLSTGYASHGRGVSRVTARAVGPTGKLPRLVQATIIH